MTTLGVRTIDALRREHDDLSARVRSLDDAGLGAASGADGWTVAQVLSHLGSGSEINLAGLQVALGERPPTDDDFNQSAWDRWDALAPADQRAGYLEHSLALVTALEALTPEQHDSVQITLPYLPAPVSVTTYAAMRLSEAAHHGWDVRVASDPAAVLLENTTAVLLDHFGGDLGFLLGFVGKADQVAAPVVLALGTSGYSIAISDSVALVASEDEPTAVFAGPLEAAMRLIAGRLGPAHTPAEVAVTGNVTLAELRAVFPGF